MGVCVFVRAKTALPSIVMIKIAKKIPCDACQSIFVTKEILFDYSLARIAQKLAKLEYFQSYLIVLQGRVDTDNTNLITNLQKLKIVIFTQDFNCHQKYRFTALGLHLKKIFCEVLTFEMHYSSQNKTKELDSVKNGYDFRMCGKL